MNEQEKLKTVRDAVLVSNLSIPLLCLGMFVLSMGGVDYFDKYGLFAWSLGLATLILYRLGGIPWISCYGLALFLYRMIPPLVIFFLLLTGGVTSVVLFWRRKRSGLLLFLVMQFLFVLETLWGIVWMNAHIKPLTWITVTIDVLLAISLIVPFFYLIFLTRSSIREQFT